MPPASLVRALTLGGAPPLSGLTYLSKPGRGDIGALIDGHQLLPKFIELIKAALCGILLLYRKLYLNIVSIISRAAKYTFIYIE